MIFVISRPFVWLFKLLRRVLLMPVRTLRSIRDWRYRRQVRSLNRQAKAAKKEALRP